MRRCRATPEPSIQPVSFIQMTDNLNNRHDDEYRDEQERQQYKASQRSVSLAEASSSDGMLDMDESGFGPSGPRYDWPGRRICW